MSTKRIIEIPRGRFFTVLTLLTALGFLVANSSLAQTLKLRFPFDDAGPGTTTASDTSGGGLAVTLNMESQTAGNAVDLHGAAGSGIQGQGRALNQSTNNILGNVPGTIAFVNNDPNIGSLGTVSSFTATIWFKLTSPPANTVNQGPRFFIIGTNTVIDSGAANSIAMNFNTAAGFPSNSIVGRVNGGTVSLPMYSPYPVGVWQFLALTYDGSANAIIYYGTEASPAKLMAVNNVGAQTINFGTSGTLQIGNRLNGRARAVPGWLDEFRFYAGAGDVNFVESIRQSSCPVLISGLTPDGSTLMEGTNALSFTASSANTINTNSIKVALNGTDISSNLVFGGTPSAVTVSYTGLPVNPTLVNNANLNGARLGIRVTDAGGIIASNLYTYDTFSPTNFTWEVEDYNYSTNAPFSGGGNFIDNPRYAFVSAADTYYQKASEILDDYDDNGNPAGTSRIYRSALDSVETEFCLGTGNNGGTSVGELMRQKVLDAFALDSTIREVNVGYFDGGTGADLPNWMNYTRTFPAGPFNVYTRVASGGGTLSSTLSQVTSGVGTTTQTTNLLGTFTFANTGGWDSFAWVPLRDSGGNLVRLNLGGVATLRLTAGSAGGGNNNFIMLTPANTNLPTISNIYPNGTNMFQPWPTLSFTVASPTGIAINNNSIRVQLSVATITRSFVTNLTSTNGLTITVTTSNKTVSCNLITNAAYTAVISVTDAIGSPAVQNLSFDTYSKILTWEAEDYDYGGGLTYDPTNTVNEYANAVGTVDVDYHDVSATQGTHIYRPSDTAGTEVNGDSPPRLEYIGTGFTDYDVGWYDNGDWNNYTRTIPTGQFNVVMRAANGTTGNGSVALSRVTSGVGTTTQTTAALGTFTIPATGGWQTYTWVPLRDVGGNLVQLTGTGVQQTLRATSGGGNNANFYLLIAANTNQPTIASFYPNGATFFQATNRFAFTVNAAGGSTISSNSVTVTLDGTVLTGLQFTGSPSTGWTVFYNGLTQNTNHTVTINVTDSNGNTATLTVTFDTFKSSYYTWEAEDYDHDSGQFTDNPQVDAYAGLGAVAGVDFNDVNTGGTYLYRPSGTATEITADTPRAQFAGTNDYNIGFFGAGEWGNYTRTYPGGTYNVWGRFACGSANTSQAVLSIVTSGWGTTSQTTNFLGTFAVPTTGWASFGWIPMRDNNGNLASVTLNGSTNTLKMLRDPTPPFADVNVNFLMLVPVLQGPVLSASHSGNNIIISFLSEDGLTYQLQFKNNITDLAWTSLGNSILGDGTIKSFSDSSTGTHKYYRVLATQ
ncbi:MAG: hypothetical protein C5B50_19780 [Verrucomicrobia bacterium]|nr:MAG: hypothetical protein C5B50_19780 [Verrucomicrobiota bacterium]